MKYILLLSLLAFLNCSWNGIDVSVWQGPNIDFKKVKAAGKNFVIIRAGIGTSVDKYFESNYKKAKAAGMNVGVYWYAKALTEKASLEEAQHALKAISGKQLEYPVYYDIEQKEILAKGKTHCSAIATKFCSYMESNKKFYKFMPQKATLIHISPTKLKKLIQYGLHNIILNAHIQENIMYGKNHLPEKLMV